MSMRIAPQFLVEDLDRALAYYREKLGFAQKIDYEGFYASVERDGAEIHLKCADDVAGAKAHRQDNQHVHALIEVDDLASLFDEVSARGAEIHQPLETQPWGTRDFVVLDVDGHVICFLQNAD